MFRTGFPKQVLFGELMQQDSWNELNRIAAEDPDFSRTGWHHLETK
jgi:hypothetical protein